MNFQPEMDEIQSYVKQAIELQPRDLRQTYAVYDVVRIDGKLTPYYDEHHFQLRVYFYNDEAYIPIDKKTPNLVGKMTFYEYRPGEQDRTFSRTIFKGDGKLDLTTQFMRDYCAQ
jgi:hypothetical protein